jgi:hypothetical protein
MDEKSILSLFENNELLISQLYDIYSEMFPRQKDFWSKLSGEEIAHAEEISQMDTGSTADSFVENKFSRGVVKYVTDFVEQQIEIARTKKLSSIEAINIALRIEQSILEKKCFDMFAPTDATLKEVLDKLNRDTDRHVRMLQKELERISKQ